MNNAQHILAEAIAKLEALTETLATTEATERAKAANLTIHHADYWKHEDAADAAFYSLLDLKKSGLLDNLKSLR